MFLSRALNHYRPGLAFLSGLMLALSFPKFNLCWLAWVAPGLVLALGAGQSGWNIFRIGFYAGLGHYLASLYWLLLIPMRLQAVAAWLGLSVYLAFFLAAWCWVCWWCSPRSQKPEVRSQTSDLRLLTTASRLQRILWAAFCGGAWVAMEMGLARILTGFPWNLLGASQYEFLPLIQIGSVAGVYGVSFMVVWISVALAGAVLTAWRSPRTVSVFAREMAVPGIVLAGVVLFGFSKLAVPESAGGYLKVALVQPGIPQRVIWDANEKTNRFNKLLDLSRTALAQKPDLLVWPEAALPDKLGRTRETQDIITALVRAHDAWMIFGGADSGRNPAARDAEEIVRFNSAFCVNPAGDLVARYHKRRLVVFGEYMPAVRWLPFLKYLRETGGGFGTGKGPVTFQIEKPRARISPLICFEDVFPHLAREYVDEETDFLLNLTNNGWFGDSAAQWQHAVSALFRAVENGVPLVRCTNNGLTCWIDARGRMHEVYFPGSRDIYQAGFKVARIPLRSPAELQHKTFYNRYGDWFGWSCVGITGLALAWSFRPARLRG